MTRNPKLNSCFRSVNCYNVDFSKYEFPNRCDRCGFGATSRKSFHRHLCNLTLVLQPFPVEDPSLTPPYRVFAGTTPNLVGTSQPPSTDTNNPAPPADSLPSQVSLVSEAIITQLSQTSTQYYN